MPLTVWSIGVLVMVAIGLGYFIAHPDPKKKHFVVFSLVLFLFSGYVAFVGFSSDKKKTDRAADDKSVIVKKSTLQSSVEPQQSQRQKHTVFVPPVSVKRSGGAKQRWHGLSDGSFPVLNDSNKESGNDFQLVILVRGAKTKIVLPEYLVKETVVKGGPNKLVVDGNRVSLFWDPDILVIKG